MNQVFVVFFFLLHGPMRREMRAIHLLTLHKKPERAYEYNNKEKISSSFTFLLFFSLVYDYYSSRFFWLCVQPRSRTRASS